MSAQETEDSSARKKLDSVFKIYNRKITEEAYINHLNILKESKKLSYLERELEAYKSLAWYHGNGYTRKKNLDSTLYYFNSFESKALNIDTTNKDNSFAKYATYSHYMRKGNILINNFGFIETGLEAYFDGYSFINKNNAAELMFYDVLLAQVYYYKKEYDKSIEVAEPHLKDTIHLNLEQKLYLMQNMALFYSSNNMPENSFKINNKILDIAKKEKNTYYIWWTKGELINDYFLFGEYKKAIDSAMVVRKYYTENPNPAGLFSNSKYLSKCYYNINNLDQAIYYLEDIIDYDPGIQERPDFYTTLASHYREKKDYTTAMNYLKQKDELVDSLRSVERSQFVVYMDVNKRLFKEIESSREISFENQLLEKNNEQQKLYVLIISSVLVSLLLLLGGLFVYKKYKQNKKVVGVLKANEKQLLQEQIRLRDNELDASAIAIAQKVEVLNTIKKELEAIKDENPKLAQVNKTVKSLIRSSSDISLVTDRIESQYPSLTVELKNKHPELSNTEIRYCLLTKLNLSLKETASMLNVTPNTVKVTRSRLKKKMSIYQDVSLKEYLDRIFVNTAASA